MGLCAPAVVAANAALEGSAADDGLVVIARQLVKVPGIFQLVGGVGQGREGHAAAAGKTDARNGSGQVCAVHMGAAAAFLRVDRAVLGKVLPDVVAPCAHFAPGSAVGSGLPGAKTQIGDFCQFPAQREEHPELRYFCPFALPCHGDVAAACAVDGKIITPRENAGFAERPHRGHNTSRA